MDRWSIAFAVLLEDPVSVLSTLVRGSELPVTPAPENLMSSPGLYRHTYMIDVERERYMYLYTRTLFFLSKRKRT